MLICSGLRINELLKLESENVFINDQYIKIVKSKTDAGIRIVPIADKTLPFWKDFYKQKNKYLITTERGIKLTDDNFRRRYLNPFQKLFTLNHTPHETRHTFTSLLVNVEINPTMIKKLLGHTSHMELYENIYTHVNIKEMLEAVNKL